MNIKPKTWITFVIAAAVGTTIWLNLTYPLFSNIDLSITRQEALKIAKDYLVKERGDDISDFKKSVVFTTDHLADRYLQKSIGFEGENKFLQDHDFELFFWVVKFFKEKEKEEFLLSISCATGEITAFRRTIEDSAFRKDIKRDVAKKKIMQFLSDTFDLDLNNYSLQGDLLHELDNRSEHAFSFQKNGVYVPWSDKAPGGAKLIIGATISGDEILSFSKYRLAIPDEFNRHMDSQKNIGRNLLTFFKIFYILLFVGAIFYVVLRRNHLAMHTTKNFYFWFVGIILVVTVLSNLNQFEHVLRTYNSTQPFEDFITRHFVNMIIAVFFGTIGILMPSLSGETLNYEIFPEKKELGFLHFIRSTFFSRKVFESICLGYLVCAILIGMQSAAFEFGRQYLGVWMEHTWITQLSSTYFPFFAAFVIGLKAGTFEEIIFRLFAIGWIKKITKSTILAVIISSILWGFGHSGYLVFPMWFRGIEVSLLGIFISVIFLRFGIIPVIVAHYLFDVFWSSIGVLFGKAEPFTFYSSLLMLFIPFIFGVLAYIRNEPVKERPLTWKINKHQKFNIEVLKSYVRQLDKTGKTREELKREIVSHGWDIAVVDLVLDEFYKS